jgi:hypothetical protein
LGNTTKILRDMTDQPQQKIPVMHGDLSLIARKVGVDSVTVWRWYHGIYKKRIEKHDELMQALLDIYEERKEADDETHQRMKDLGLK